ncbi:MAG: 4Fe-4S binding protein [Planctomycetes bacterium]|nr:4Fe-4S binding protein [Planctomycetota bacterium]
MNTAAPPTAARPNYGRRRAWTLLGVHLAFAAHIVHWRLAGRTLAPLELNELMYTLEAGIVTAGFLLMVLVTLSVAVFGRFFCSWGCHVLAVQDGSAWLLEKLGLRPKTFRMRMLALVPLGALLYMFVWPQVRFVLLGAPRPALRVTDDSSGWASFVTSDFWRNLPGPGIAITTFLVCGTAMVGLMGRRAFCRYGCPYGALFALMDRVAPGRIARIGDCSACGKCTAACTSDVKVHEELEAHGQVVDPACLKDLDCLAACPDGAIGFRFRGSKALSVPRAGRVPRKAWMTTRGEELFMALAFVPLLLVFRGLYGLLPFLMSLGLAALTSFLAVIGWRLVRARDAALVRRPLKVAGRLTPVGRGAALAIGAWLALVAHSTVLRAAQARGATIVAEGVHELALARADAAVRARCAGSRRAACSRRPA